MIDLTNAAQFGLLKSCANLETSSDMPRPWVCAQLSHTRPGLFFCPQVIIDRQTARLLRERFRTVRPHAQTSPDEKGNYRSVQTGFFLNKVFSPLRPRAGGIRLLSQTVVQSKSRCAHSAYPKCESGLIFPSTGLPGLKLHGRMMFPSFLFIVKENHRRNARFQKLFDDALKHLKSLKLFPRKWPGKRLMNCRSPLLASNRFVFTASGTSWISICGATRFVWRLTGNNIENKRLTMPCEINA